MVFRNPRTRQLEPVQKAIRQAEGDEQKAREIFIEEYFTKGKPCYIERTYPDAISFIDAIHESGGMAVLSGWHVDELDNETLVDLIEAGLDGLEVFTPDVDSKTAAFLLKVASDEKLFVTAGSDYHGSKRQTVNLEKQIVLLKDFILLKSLPVRWTMKSRIQICLAHNFSLDKQDMFLLN